MKTIFLLLLLTVTAYSQELPEYRDINALEGKTKVYVTADAKDRETIIKELKKEPKLSIVDKPDDAEFVLAYKTLGTERSVGVIFERGQLNAYFLENKKQIIAWSKESRRTIERTSYDATKQFIKDWRKAFIK
jgi:hypothetical protein